MKYYKMVPVNRLRALPRCYFLLELAQLCCQFGSVLTQFFPQTDISSGESTSEANSTKSQPFNPFCDRPILRWFYDSSYYGGRFARATGGACAGASRGSKLDLVSCIHLMVGVSCSLRSSTLAISLRPITKSDNQDPFPGCAVLPFQAPAIQMHSTQTHDGSRKRDGAHPWQGIPGWWGSRERS